MIVVRAAQNTIFITIVKHKFYATKVTHQNNYGILIGWILNLFFNCQNLKFCLPCSSMYAYTHLPTHPFTYSLTYWPQSQGQKPNRTAHGHHKNKLTSRMCVLTLKSACKFWIMCTYTIWPGNLACLTSLAQTQKSKQSLFIGLLGEG